MKFHYLKTDGSSVQGNIMSNVENIHYRDYMIIFHANSIIPVMASLVENDLGPFPDGYVPKCVISSAFNQAMDAVDAYREITLPEGLKMVIDNPSLKKKQQVSLLKGVSLSVEQLCALFLYSDGQGYCFSNIRFEGKPKQFPASEVPSFIFINEYDDVEYSGNTTLSDAQLKSIVRESNFLLARILTKDNHWLCFLQDKRSILGKEPGEQGSRPHIHFISDAFGVNVEDFKIALKNGSYPHTKVHIPLINYEGSCSLP